MPRNEPKCPDCNWRLSFEKKTFERITGYYLLIALGVETLWVAKCWNPNCQRDYIEPE